MHASICDQLHDIVQNAIEAGSSDIAVDWLEYEKTLDIAVADNGCGMTEEVREKALDPFFTDGRKHKHRRVGLGLAFLKQMVEETGGHWELQTARGQGTRIHFCVDRQHVDLPPVGDIVRAIADILSFPGEHDMRVRRQTVLGEYTVRRTELQDALGELQTATSLVMMRDYIASQEEALQKG